MTDTMILMEKRKMYVGAAIKGAVIGIYYAKLLGYVITYLYLRHLVASVHW